MGGSLYTKRRLDRAEYKQLEQEVLQILGLPPAAIPRTFSEKESFGDLDVCLLLPVATPRFIREKFGTDETYYNTSVVSFGYKDFQIDLCHFPDNELRTAIDYMAFGDLSNMIGVIANYALGLRYTHRGLTAPVKLKQEEPLGEVIITTDTLGALEFMDLDSVKWQQGFANEHEAFNWIIKSRYFNKEFFQFENLNHQNRTRNRKRAMYSRFVDWCNSRTFDISHEPTANKAEHLWRASLYFGSKWFNRGYDLVTAHREKLDAAKVFSGEDVKFLTGLEGKALGECLTAYKRLGRCDDGDWRRYLLNHGREYIIKDFMKWYESDYQKII